MLFDLMFRRYAPFDTFGGGFEGDGRTGPSTSLAATARTIGLIQFGPGYVGATQGSTSGTSYKAAGAKIEQLLGKHSAKVLCATTVKACNSSAVRFSAYSSGSIPLQSMLKVVPQRFVPAIDTFIDIECSFLGSSLSIQGTVRGDNFPNAEVLIIDKDRNVRLMFHYETDGGQTTGPITRLPTDNAEQELGKFSYTASLKDGIFLHE